MCRPNDEEIKKIRWKKWREKDCKAKFYLGKGWLRIDFWIHDGRKWLVWQEFFQDVYLDKAGNLEIG